MATAPVCVPVNDALLESLERGDNAEHRFRVCVARSGGKIVAKASKTQDMFEHWDFLVGFGNKRYRIDVKAMKSLDRGQPVQDDLVCCELHGSHQDNKGWLFGGHADIVAFEVGRGFILVWRQALCRWLKDNVDLTKKVNRSSSAVNGAVYNRRDSELVTWVPREVLLTPGIMASRLE